MLVSFMVRTEVWYEVNSTVAEVAKELGISMTKLRAIVGAGEFDEISQDQRSALVQLAGRTGQPKSGVGFFVDYVEVTP